MIRPSTRHIEPLLPSDGGTVYTIGVSSSTTPAGTVREQARKPLVSASTPAGAIRKAAKALRASSTQPQGSLAARAGLSLQFSGASTPAGALLRSTRRSLAAGVAPGGTLLRKSRRALVSSTTSAGSLGARILATILTSGAASSSGVLSRKPQRQILSATQPTGAARGVVKIVRAGLVTPGGAHRLMGRVVLVGSSAASGLVNFVSRRSFSVGSETSPIGALLNTLLGPGSGNATFTHLATLDSTDNTNSYPLGSGITPLAGSMLFLGIHSTRATAASPEIPSSISAFGLEWTRIPAASIEYEAGLGRLDVYRAKVVSVTPGSVTVNYSATHNGCQISLIQVEGLNIGGDNGASSVIETNVAAASVASGQLTVNLPNAFSHVDNPVLAFFVSSNTSTYTPGAGFTTGGQVVGATPGRAMFSEYNEDNDQSVDATRSATGAATGAAAMELRAMTGQTFLLAVSGSMAAVGQRLGRLTRTVGGSISSSGSVSRQPAKRLAGSTTSAGAVRRSTKIVRSSSNTPGGSLLKKTISRLSGAVSSSGLLATGGSRSVGLAGAVAATGSLRRLVQRSITAGVASAGNLASRLVATIRPSGAVASAGALVKKPKKRLTAGITSAGALRPFRMFKRLAGTQTPMGTVRKKISRTLSSSSTPTGRLWRFVKQVFWWHQPTQLQLDASETGLELDASLTDVSIDASDTEVNFEL